MNAFQVQNQSQAWKQVLIDVTAGESGGKAMTRIYGNIGFKGLWNGLPVRIVSLSS